MLPHDQTPEPPRSDMSWRVLPPLAQLYVTAVLGSGGAVLLALFPTDFQQPWLFVGLVRASGVPGRFSFGGSMVSSGLRAK